MKYRISGVAYTTLDSLITALRALEVKVENQTWKLTEIACLAKRAIVVQNTTDIADVYLDTQFVISSVVTAGLTLNTIDGSGEVVYSNITKTTIGMFKGGKAYVVAMNNIETLSLVPSREGLGIIQVNVLEGNLDVIGYGFTFIAEKDMQPAYETSVEVITFDFNNKAFSDNVAKGVVRGNQLAQAIKTLK
jgi:hypothetical protein